MSDSDEVISSDEEPSTASMSQSGSKSELPSEELTIQDSDTNDSADESVIVRRRSNGARKKRAVVIESDSDETDNENESSANEEDEEEEEEEFERRVLSPRTRMSITGIRPADLSDSSEIYHSTVEEEDEEEEEEENAKTSMLPRSNLTEYRDVTLQGASESDSHEAPSSDRNNPFLDKSADEQSSVQSSLDHTEESNASIDQDEETKTVNKSITNNPNRLNRKNNAHNVDSPMSSARYSMQFERAIKEKLSSTIYQQSPRASQRSPVESDESDVQVISLGEKTIEISSSDGENDENVLSKANPVASGESVMKPKPSLLQPKITTQLPPKAGTPKVAAKVVEYVSQEFFDKELKKLQDLKLELQSAEKLLEKISKSLPDGGSLSLRVERLRGELSLKEQKLAYIKVEDADKPPTFKTPPLPQAAQKKNAFFNSAAPSWDELSAAVNQIQPIHTGKQGMATFNTQRELTVERLKDLHSSLKSCPTEDVLADDPKGLKVTLMDHQKHALAWMNWREQQKPRGGILADDMGLGKTLTMISLVLDGKNREENNADLENDKEESESDDGEESERWTSKGRRSFYHGGTLVVCPATLVRQWEGEVESKIKRHRLTVCVHHGNNRDTKPKHLRTYDIVVTTYNIVGRELKTQGALFGIKWRRIILDEAHVVRNHKAQMSIAVCGLRGRYRWALTGTPIQNKEMDVFALLKFLRCSPFDELPHWKKWIDNKSAGGQQRLNALMKSLMLRRTKALLQERGSLQCLPEKRIELIAVELDKNEMNVYQKIMVYSRTLFAQFLFQRAERNTDLMYAEQGNRPTFMQTKDPNGAYYKVHQKFTKMHQGTKEVKSHEILVLLLRLRQICCHPGLIDSMLEDAEAGNMDSDSDSDKTKIDLLEQLNKLAITDHSPQNSLEGDEVLKPEEEVIARASAKVLQRSNPVFDLKRPSSKMIKVIETLRKCALKSDDKAIVVSQWTSVLNILKSHLESQGIVTLSLNGSIPVKNRQAIVTDFNDAASNKRVLLLSLTAGGVGLNLVGANHLLLIDLHWNPQLEAQAQDRIYRVGQKKNVVIYKFMCKDTVEERIKALQEHKMSIADGVLTGVRAAEGSKLTMEDLRGLFGM